MQYTNNGPKPKTIYLNNKELLIAVRESKELGKMSNTLAQMLQLLCANYATKGNFAGYTYNQDMQAYAMLMLVRTWNSFDPNKGSNPFAFFTQCIKNSFIQYINQERRQRDIRDLLLVEQGMCPSYTFQENVSDTHYVEDEQDYEHIVEVAQYIQNITAMEDPNFTNIDDSQMEYEMTNDEESNEEDLTPAENLV